MTKPRKIPPEKLDELLHYDALNEAQKMTGGDYRDEKSLAHHLGFMNFGENNSKKEEALQALDDTTFHTSVERYLRIAGEIGFEVVLKLPFGGRGKSQETFYVLWRKGILLSFDTSGGDHVNGGSFWYNWMPAPGLDKAWRYTSSGHFAKHGESRLWAGHHDCREALRHHISQLEQHGKILEIWEEPGYLSLIHHGDEKKLETIERRYDLDVSARITRDRVAMLPEHVRKAILIEEA